MGNWGGGGGIIVTGSDVEAANTGGGGPGGLAGRICGEVTRCGDGTLGPTWTVGLTKLADDATNKKKTYKTVHTCKFV